MEEKVEKLSLLEDEVSKLKALLSSAQNGEGPKVESKVGSKVESEVESEVTSEVESEEDQKNPPDVHFTNGGTLIHLIDFCLLTGRFKTARILLTEQSKMFGGGISSGVHCIMTCRGLIKHTTDNPGLTKRLEINSIIYEKYVCDLIQESHRVGKRQVRNCIYL